MNKIYVETKRQFFLEGHLRSKSKLITGIHAIIAIFVLFLLRNPFLETIETNSTNWVFSGFFFVFLPLFALLFGIIVNLLAFMAVWINEKKIFSPDEYLAFQQQYKKNIEEEKTYLSHRLQREIKQSLDVRSLLKKIDAIDLLYKEVQVSLVL